MKPCISQATTMNAATRADLRAYGHCGWSLVELWLTKVEDYLRENSVADLRGLLEKHDLTVAAAAGQGGLLLSKGAQRDAHWELFRRRLKLLRELGAPVLVVAADFSPAPSADDYRRAAASLAEAGALAGEHGVRIALEFQRGSCFCASLDTALALVEGCGSPHVGVCLDLFHYYTGPSKFEDLELLTAGNLAWVQICDLAATPRELAGDADRILPGEGDFRIGPILDRLGEIGYDGPVSLEVLNPSLWASPPDRVADFGFQATERALGRWNEPRDVGGPSGSEGG